MPTITLDESKTETMIMLNLISALQIAVDMDFMAREHGAAIWKNYLKNTRYDVPKKTPVKTGKKEDIC